MAAEIEADRAAAELTLRRSRVETEITTAQIIRRELLELERENATAGEARDVEAVVNEDSQEPGAGLRPKVAGIIATSGG